MLNDHILDWFKYKKEYNSSSGSSGTAAAAVVAVRPRPQQLLLTKPANLKIGFSILSRIRV